MDWRVSARCHQVSRVRCRTEATERFLDGVPGRGLMASCRTCASVRTYLTQRTGDAQSGYALDLQSRQSL